MHSFGTCSRTCRGWVACAVLLVAVSPAFSQASGWKLASSVASPKKKPVQGDRSFAIVTDHPQLSGQMHFSAGGLNLRFRLLRGGSLLWEKPAPSDWVMIPGQADLVIMVGQQFGEGSVRLGKTLYEGFGAFDSNGNSVVEIVDTGVIGRLHLFPDGRLLYLSGDTIRLIDFRRGGRTLWSINIDTDDLDVIDGGRFFSTAHWDPKENSHETALFDVNTGKRLKSITRPHGDDPIFFAVSSDQRYAFVRTTRRRQPLLCDVAVYQIGRWMTPVTTFESLHGGPFAADRRPKDGAIALGLLIPDAEGNPKAYQAHLAIRDSQGATVFEHRFQPGPVDWDRAYMRFDPAGSPLRVLYHSTEFRFVGSTGR